MSFADRTVKRFAAGLIPLGAALVICATCLVRYSPRYVFWRGLDIPEALIYPEVNRAHDVLKQLADPTIQIDDHNAIINGRLLFPIIGHLLRLSRAQYLAIPFLGCVLAVALTIHYVQRAARSWPAGMLAGAIAATSSWFFCSTNWLAYFDSWFIVAGLLVAFSPSGWLLAAACVLGPWVDERATILMPLAVLVRLIFHRLDQQPFLKSKRDVLFIGLCMLPYLVVRLTVWGRLDVKGGHFFALRMIELPRYGVPWQGAWMALRAGWVFVAVAAWWTFRRRQPMWTAAFIAVFIPTAVCALLIAGDVARSTTIFLPLAILGVIVLAREDPRTAIWVASIVVLLNFSLPAAQNTMTFVEPIPTLWGALDELHHPPDELNPAVYNAAGANALRRGQLGQADHDLQTALLLDPASAPAHVNLAQLSARQGDMPRARTEVEAAKAAAPTDPDVQLIIGVLEMNWGDPASARAAFETADRLAPLEWARRQQCREYLDRLSSP